MTAAGHSGLPQLGSGGAEGGLSSRRHCGGYAFSGDDEDEGNCRSSSSGRRGPRLSEGGPGTERPSSRTAGFSVLHRHFHLICSSAVPELQTKRIPNLCLQPTPLCPTLSPQGESRCLCKEGWVGRQGCGLQPQVPARVEVCA